MKNLSPSSSNDDTKNNNLCLHYVSVHCALLDSGFIRSSQVKNAKLDMIHFTQITQPSPTAIIWAMENHTSASSLTEQGRQRDMEREGERVCVGVCLSERASKRAREEGRRAQPAQPTQRDRTTSFRKQEERERERERERVGV